MVKSTDYLCKPTGGFSLFIQEKKINDNSLCELTIYQDAFPYVLWSLRQGFYTGLEGIYQIFTALRSLLSDTETQSQIYKTHLSHM